MSMRDDILSAKTAVSEMFALPKFTVADPDLNGFLTSMKNLVNDTLDSVLSKFP